MAITATFKKRAKAVDLFPVPTIFFDLSLVDPLLSLPRKGFSEIAVVITHTTPYNTVGPDYGFTLPVPAQFSNATNLADTYLHCMKLNQLVFPASGYTMWDDPCNGAEYWTRVALNQNTAFNAGKQFRIDPAYPGRLRVSEIDSATEITAASDILNSTQILVFIYHTAPSNIAWVDV